MESSEMDDIEGAFAAFGSALRDGGFDFPVDPEGWAAELIAAHVIMSNDLLTEAARALRTGSPPAYDNRPASDRSALREVLIRTGSLPELADEVDRSASDLQAAYGMLRPEQRQAAMSTRIVHEGEPLLEGSRPIGTMIEDNAGAHLDGHLAQLLELRE